MKRKIMSVVCILALMSISLSACTAGQTTESIAENASPENLYKNDNSIDMLIYNDKAYVNAENLDWVSELELNCDQLIGAIKRTNVTKDFDDFDATKLAVNVEVYSVVERNDFVLVEIDDNFIPYYAWVEG